MQGGFEFSLTRAGMSQQYQDAWQFPALHCCRWWCDVNYCVENCLHWGWGGCIVITCTCKRLKMHIVDDVENVFVQRCELPVSKVPLTAIWILQLKFSCMDYYLSAPPKLQFMWSKSKSTLYRWPWSLLAFVSLSSFICMIYILYMSLHSV